MFILYDIYTAGFDSLLYQKIKPDWLYRIIQKILEGIGLLLIYHYGNIYDVLACLECHYTMVMDRLYYIFKGQDYKLKEYQDNNEDVFWLKRFYFTGIFLFKNKFSIFWFNTSAIAGVIIGLAITIISNL